MKIRVADYIADVLVKNGIRHVFTVTGGGSMHLNDALGHKKGLTCIYQHHEQACAMAAESYARVQNGKSAESYARVQNGKPAESYARVQNGKSAESYARVQNGRLAESYARVQNGRLAESYARVQNGKSAESYARVQNGMAAVCVTTGPGGTNALTGVLGAWLDSIPMLVLSGQVRFDTTVRSTGLGLRAFGDQEFDIIQAVSGMTKYAEMVTDPENIRYCLEKALFLAGAGRPGPCWLDIPLDVQGALIDAGSLEAYDPAEDGENQEKLPPKVTDETACRILDKINAARRPVLNAGNGIRTAGAGALLLRVAEQLQVPVVTGWNSIDLIYDAHPLYAGRAGIMGDRAGNWAVQNCDVLLSVGSRLSVRQVGYQWDSWARDAYTIVEDVDREELKKPSIHVDLPVWADAYDLLEALDRNLKIRKAADERKRTVSGPKQAGHGNTADLLDAKQMQHMEWLRCCRDWRARYPVVHTGHFRQQPAANVYAFIRKLSEALPENRIIVAGNGSASVVGSQAFMVRPGQRFIINSGAASMGYDLPAAAGACLAAGCQEVVCITGDGSIQMNLQELQTVIHHRLPIKIFVINNQGYHSIRQTQRNYFDGPLAGVGTDSRDLSFPSMEKLAGAYGYPYYRIGNNAQFVKIAGILESEGACICEVIVDTQQCFEPKAASRRLADGTIASLPLEDLAPHLPADELAGIMKAAHLPEDGLAGIMKAAHLPEDGLAGMKAAHLPEDGLAGMKAAHLPE